MTEGIETTWILPEEALKGTETKQRHIDEMDLSELRTMMCPKSAGDYGACGKCAGIKTCTVGQRISLLTEAIGSSHPVAIDRYEFIQACESGNPWGHLIDKGMSKGAAREKIIGWIKRFPSVADQHGGEKRLLAKPRILRAKTDGSISTPVTRRDASDASDDQILDDDRGTPTEAEKAQNSEGTHLTGRDLGAVRGGAVIRDRTLMAAKAAFESNDPIRYIMETEGASWKTARQKVARWMAKYPEVSGGYKIPNLRQKLKTMVEDTKKPEDDEMDLLDFLATFDEPEERTMEPNLAAKKAELETQRNRIIAEIKGLEERKECIERDLEAINRVSLLFA